MIEYLLAYLAGLLTLVNPCVLPVLPIVLAASLQADRRGPFALAAGLSISFVCIGLFVLTLGSAVGIDQASMTTAGAWLMIAFGIVLLVPRLNEGFATVTQGLSGRADARLQAMDESGKSTGIAGQFAGGALLGAIWSPCIGPTLGGAISLASQGQDLLRATIVMIFFALGVSSIVVALGFGTHEVVARRRQALRIVAQRAKPILGITFLCVGTAILFGLDHWLEEAILNLMPIWLQDLSVSI